LKRISRTVFVGFELKTKNFQFIFKVGISETPTLALFKFVLQLISWEWELSFSKFLKEEKQIKISTNANSRFVNRVVGGIR